MFVQNWDWQFKKRLRLTALFISEVILEQTAYLLYCHQLPRLRIILRRPRLQVQSSKDRYCDVVLDCNKELLPYPDRFSCLDIQVHKTAIDSGHFRRSLVLDIGVSNRNSYRLTSEVELSWAPLHESFVEKPDFRLYLALNAMLFFICFVLLATGSHFFAHGSLISGFHPRACSFHDYRISRVPLSLELNWSKLRYVCGQLMTRRLIIGL